MNSSILPVLCTLLLCSASVLSLEEDLMDTRTATSDIGWTTPQGSEWQEASTSHSDGNERRVLMVCRMHKAKQNNWVRSPYIPINGANRIYVEFEFTMRSCEDVPNVATCKETFNLYYYETDRDEATSTFPPWNEYSYTKVDTIAADKRFHRGTAETNIETRDIGPLKKNGIYLALQDTGACMALMHVRVYYKYCPQTTMNLAQFPKTIAGPERTSLVAAEGACVPHASKATYDVATLHCNSDGVWAVPKGQCLCGPGFTSSQDRTSCDACGRGLYKPTNDNSPCRRCPAYSHSHQHGSMICDCMFGYFRSTSDPPTSLCTKPPSEPINLRAVSNETTVRLAWERPLNDGGRDDLYYRIECEECLEDFTSCSACPLALSYFPARANFDVTKAKVRGLRSFTFYKFKVYAENSVSSIAHENNMDGNHATVTITTDQARPPKITGVFATNIDSYSLTVSWSSPATSEDFVYEVLISDYSPSPARRVNASMLTNVEINNLSPATTYFIEVRASNEMGYGPFSDPLKTQTMGLDTTPPTAARKDVPDETLTIVVAVLIGAVCVIVATVAVLCWRRRGHRNHKPTEFDPEKHPMFNTSSSLLLNFSYPVEKSYVDPLTYEDPQKAISDFAKEIEFTRVKIEAVIGGGEFGEVCRGRLQLPGNEKSRDVAIKTLKSVNSSKQKLDFLGEASIMGQFDHPNVIRLEGVVTKSRPLMIITEFMENGSLDAYLKKHDGGLSVIELCGMLRNIGSGMKYLADMGYIHRDLAARNILVDSELVCKVSDFGMSRVLEEDDNATYTARGGKIPIRWTAPEAITFRKFTSASDVWSYGIVMWEVTSYGERPYWSMSNTDVMQAVDSGYRLPAPMDCPLVLHQLMLECWKKERSQRPKFGEIVAAIERMLRDPAQFKIVAGINYNNNGRLIPTGDRISLPSKETLSGKISSLRPEDHIVHGDVTAMTSWLDKIGLSSYQENFLQSGYYDVESICRLKPNDLCKLGITDPNDQNVLLDNVYSLKCNHHNKETADYGLEGVAV